MTTREQLIKALRAFENDLRLGRQVWIPASTMQAAADMLEADGVPIGHQYQSASGEWCNFLNEKHYQDTLADGRWSIRAIYAKPQPTQPVQRAALTDEYIDELWCKSKTGANVTRKTVRHFARAIEAANVIKEGGDA